MSISTLRWNTGIAHAYDSRGQVVAGLSVVAAER